MLHRPFSRVLAAAAFLTLSPQAFAQTGVVNVYTSREPALIKPALDAFTQATAIKVNTVFIQNGLEERVKAEGANSPADIIITVDAAKLVNAVDLGILQKPSNMLTEAAIAPSLRDPEGRWSAVTLRSRVVYASKDRVKENAIHYEDLADPKWKGKICIRSGQHPYNISLIAAMIAHHGVEKTEAWLRGVKANLAKKPSGGDRDVAKDILAGVCDIGIGNTYYVGLMLKDKDQRAWGEAIKVLDSTFKNGGTHVNISGVGLAKNAPNKANAEKLIGFLLSDQAQVMLATLNEEYPVRAGVSTVTTEKLFGPIKPDSFSLIQIASQRKKASELVDKVGFDQ
jgi:iron(III) transport system substrate-binding protein